MHLPICAILTTKEQTEVSEVNKILYETNLLLKERIFPKKKLTWQNHVQILQIKAIACLSMQNKNTEIINNIRNLKLGIIWSTKQSNQLSRFHVVINCIP